MTAANAQDVVVVRYSKRDARGDVGVFTEHVLHGCLVAPGGSSEDLSSGDTVTTRWSVYVLSDADVRAEDRIRLGSDPAPADGAPPRVRGPWQVAGDPQPWRSPWSSWSPGSVVTIERASS